MPEVAMPEVARGPDDAVVDTSEDFAEWVASRSASLQPFAYLVTGSSADAPDLVQEALLGALPRWESLVRRGTAEGTYAAASSTPVSPVGARPGGS